MSRYPAANRFRRRAPPGARGFTLVEAAIVMVIVGFAVLAMLELLAAGSVTNAESAEMTTGVTLANNIRELSLGLPLYDPNQDPKVAPRVWNSKEASVPLYDNVTDLDGNVDTWNNQAADPIDGYQKFQPPVDGTRKSIPGLSNWAQYVKVETVSPDNLRIVLPQDPDAEAARITVKVTKDGVEVYRTRWFVCAPLAANKPSP